MQLHALLLVSLCHPYSSTIYTLVQMLLFVSLVLVLRLRFVRKR